jgi:phage tail tape-measure protein
VRRGVEDFVRGGDVAGLARATTVVAGLTATAIGYASGYSMTTRTARRRGWSGKSLTRSSPRGPALRLGRVR